MEVTSEISSVRSEVGSLRTEVAGAFRTVHTRIDALDRDVQALVAHTSGIDRG